MRSISVIVAKNIKQLKLFGKRYKFNIFFTLMTLRFCNPLQCITFVFRLSKI